MCTNYFDWFVMRSIFPCMLVLCLFISIMPSEAGTTFKNGVISSGNSLSSGKPEKRDDLKIDLKKIDQSHLDQVMSRRDAIRFERRVGIGAPIERFERYVGKTRRQAIKLVIDELRNFNDPYQWPAWIEDSVPIGFLQEALQNNRANCSAGVYRESLASEWSRHILNSKVPQYDRQALLWLDHFSVAYDTYDRSHAFAEHLKIIRKYTNGNYVDFLKASLEDPGVIIYLNNETSTKDNPNENLAREFLELFSLGEGQYGEGEIRNLAKMLAGNGINFINEEFVNKPSKRTSSTQSAFGEKYKSIDEFFEILVDHPYFGAFVAKKFFNEYIALEEPPAQDLAILVTSFRKAKFDIPSLLEATLSLESFWSDENKLTLVKSPIDLLFGTARTLKSTANAGNMTLLTKGIKDLNQDLFNPPNIAGWPTGRDWIGGQLIEKRITKLNKVFRNLDTAAAPKLIQSSNDDQKYKNRLQEFFETAQKDQLAVEMITIDWIAEDFGKRRWNDTNISFYNVRLNGKHYDGINIRFGHDRNDKNRYGDFVEVAEGFSSPDIFRSYNNGWMDDSNGAMTVKFSYPSGKRNKRFVGRSAHEKLLIKRLTQSMKLLVENKHRYVDLYKSPGGIAWMESMIDKIGFDPITTATGSHPPVVTFSQLQANHGFMAKNAFSCGSKRIGFNYRQVHRFHDDFFAFNDVVAKAQSMDMGLSELLIPDLNLPTSDEDYMNILTYEGYQLK